MKGEDEYRISRVTSVNGVTVDGGGVGGRVAVADDGDNCSRAQATSRGDDASVDW